MTALVVTLAVVVALLVVLVAGLLRSHAEILRTLHDAGLAHDPDAAADAPAPAPAGRRRARPTPTSGPSPEASDLSGVTPDGDAVAVGVLGAAEPTLLAFLSSGCLTCREFWETFADPALDVPGGARLVVVTMSPEDESVGALRRLATDATPVVMSTPAWEAYEVEGSPYFVYVDGVSGAVVGEGTASDLGPRPRDDRRVGRRRCARREPPARRGAQGPRRASSPRRPRARGARRRRAARGRDRAR